MKRVLILDDDALTARVVADGLRSRGWDALVCTAAQEGYAAVVGLRPDAVVLDAILPGSDGAALCAAIRLAPGPRIPVLIYSGSDFPREAAARAGADAFFGKPVPIDEVHAKLVQLVPEEAPPAHDPFLAGPVRLPAGEVVGGQAASPRPDAPGDEGEVRAGWLPPLLLRLHDRRFTGVLEVEAGDWRCKVFFQRGAPASARSSDRETELGAILAQLGLASREHLDASAAEARRRGRPLGETLVSTSLLDRAAAERALREQVLRRLERAAGRSSGQWRVLPVEPVGLAGYEVPAAVAFWRVGGDAEVLVDADESRRYVRLGLPGWAWPLVDPHGTLAAGRAALLGGATLGESLAAGGEPLSRLVAILRRFALLSLTDTPPSVSPRDGGLSLAETAALEERIAAQDLLLGDADHYTVLGLAPDALDVEVSAAVLTAVATIHPDTLPAGVSAATRERAQRRFAAVVEAGRVLGDVERRTIYDAELNRRERRELHRIGAENNAVLLAERAREAFSRREHVSAAALFRAALRLEGDDPDILAMLGRARHLACPGDTAAGLGELRRAVALDPDAEEALFWLASIYIERGEADEARVLLRRALARNHEFEPAREALRSLST